MALIRFVKLYEDDDGDWVAELLGWPSHHLVIHGKSQSEALAKLADLVREVGG